MSGVDKSIEMNTKHSLHFSRNYIVEILIFQFCQANLSIKWKKKKCIETDEMSKLRFCKLFIGFKMAGNYQKVSVKKLSNDFEYLKNSLNSIVMRWIHFNGRKSNNVYFKVYKVKIIQTTHSFHIYYYDGSYFLPYLQRKYFVEPHDEIWI